MFVCLFVLVLLCFDYATNSMWRARKIQMFLYLCVSVAPVVVACIYYMFDFVSFLAARAKWMTSRKEREAVGGRS